MKYWLCNNTNDPWKRYTKGKNPDKEGHMVYKSICMKSPELGNPQRQIVDYSLLGYRWGLGWGSEEPQIIGTFGVKGHVLELDSWNGCAK